MRWTNTRLLGQQRLGFLRRLADNRPVVADAERAQLELMPGGTGTADLLLAAVLLLVTLCRPLRDRCRAAAGPMQRDDDRGADRAEDIGDGVGDRHRIEELLGLFRRKAEAVDRVGRKTHRRRNRLRTRIEPRGGTDVVAGQFGGEIGADQTEHADHRGIDRLRKSVRRDAAHELRSDRVADGEQEHQEEERLERPVTGMSSWPMITAAIKVAVTAPRPRPL